MSYSLKEKDRTIKMAYQKFLILHMFPNRGKEYNLYFFETEFHCEFENETPFTYRRTIMKLIGSSILDIETPEKIDEMIERIN